MRLLSAAQIKLKLRGRKSHALQVKPREGSRLREMYDRLMSSLGKPVNLFEGKSREEVHSCLSTLHQLYDHYGLDVRLIQHGSIYKPSLYSIVGEWFGSIYIDYTSETEEQMDRLAEARYALQHAERVENILPAGVHHLSKDSIEILERVAEHGRKLASKHLKKE